MSRYICPDANRIHDFDINYFYDYNITKCMRDVYFVQSYLAYLNSLR